MRIGWAVGILLALGQLQSAAQTVEAEAPVVRLQLYKNGLAVAHRRIDIPADGAQVRALPEHATRLHPFHELRWTLTLAPNETATLDYGYTRIE